MDNARKTVSWDGLSIPMAVPVPPPSSPKPITHYTCAQSTGRYDTYVVTKSLIKEAKYELISPQQVVDSSTYLNSTQKHHLIALLKQFPRLFSGKLGRYNKGKFTLELQNPFTKPIFCKPYPVAQVHTSVFKKEFNHLIKENV